MKWLWNREGLTFTGDHLNPRLREVTGHFRFTHVVIVFVRVISCISQELCDPWTQSHLASYLLWRCSQEQGLGQRWEPGSLHGELGGPAAKGHLSLNSAVHGWGGPSEWVGSVSWRWPASFTDKYSQQLRWRWASGKARDWGPLSLKGRKDFHTPPTPYPPLSLPPRLWVTVLSCSATRPSPWPLPAHASW